MRGVPTIAFLAATMPALAAPSALAAQEVTDPDMEVDSIELTPGEGLVFGFGEGYSHQLLYVRHRGAEALSAPLEDGEVRAVFHSDEIGSRLEIENGTGETLYFDALADRRGSGGYGSVPVNAVPPGERAEAGRWDFAIHSIVIGEFSYGPHGDHEH